MKIVKSHKRSVIASRTSRGKQFGIKAARSDRIKIRKYTVKASKKIAGSQGIDADEDGYSVSDNKRFEQEQFAENFIHKLEGEYYFKVPTDTWGKIKDLADDLSFGADAHKHGSTHLLYLAFAIYDIIEEDMGVVIGSTTSYKNTSVTATQTDTTVSQEDVDELVLYITNDGRLYEQITTPIIKNMKRKRRNGNYRK